ncbi:hypothetical protein M431DRAFT_198376 [Trichoderma harzianum CBS 226.95]|uniref:Secreted protein n=1 Tax=Trichoderma harzianum CBS 226.95 TaxID=983964 RepID=A0A2T4AV52_TRIHA|nr:hypothetical protein M431DRAFT_198376 [Trichoderma harzianum CBS 226.95]PTB60848.1 hypothetical protein M431DRAFT_198376 [Trichoderma harzianum CBS 226.95]
MMLLFHFTSLSFLFVIDGNVQGRTLVWHIDWSRRNTGMAHRLIHRKARQQHDLGFGTHEMENWGNGKLPGNG